MRVFAGLTFAAVLAGRVLGQTAAAPPQPGPPQSDGRPATFEIADIHASPPRQNPYMRGVGLRGGRYELRDATMVDLIAAAYGVDDDKVLGGPNWLELDRFDVIAQAPRDATADAAKVMLQALLADRFQLMVHKDTRPMPGFALTVGKGKPKLKEAEASSQTGNTGCEPRPPKPQPGVIPPVDLVCHNVTMELFARVLSGWGGDYFDHPVVDQTGLKESWDFEIQWTRRPGMARAGGDGITVFDAVDKQLGLRVEAKKIPSSVIVVDSVNEKPTANQPDVAKLLPPSAPAEFEVAEIKPSEPDARPMGAIRNGRVELQGFSLKNLIRIAWDINNDDMIANEPKWLDSEKFSVLAKVSTSGPAPQVDIDELRIMLRALLVERFQMKTHMEDRLVTAYNLVADKPKLTKADPANRTGWKEGRPEGAEGKDPRDANPNLARLVTCQNMTMAQFAQQLQQIAPGYIHNPVVDATGLEGAYDFTLSFSPVGLFQSAGVSAGGGPGPSTGGQQPGAAPTASDPSGALSLFDAVKKQLGLKLDMQKRTMPVLVIDQVEEKPTEN